MAELNNMPAPRYQVLKVINQGSYGTVYRAWDKITNEIVAIKHELQGLCRTTQREIGILRSLPPHPNIVELKEVIVDRYRRVFVVMECVDYDLHAVIKDARARAKPFSVMEVHFLMKKILEGVAFIHVNGLMHRDLKPENILVSGDLSRLKICDFGLSRHMDTRSGSYTPRVGTCWYKAPELLIGAKRYTNAIDMWSVGCIMAELLLGHVAFPGKSDFDQLICIGKTRSSLLLEKVAPLLSDCGNDLLRRLLVGDPDQRLTANGALHHAWFQESYGSV